MAPLLTLVGMPAQATPPRNAASLSKLLVVVPATIVLLGPILGKNPIIVRRMGMFLIRVLKIIRKSVLKRNYVRVWHVEKNSHSVQI